MINCTTSCMNKTVCNTTLMRDQTVGNVSCTNKTSGNHSCANETIRHKTSCANKTMCNTLCISRLTCDTKCMNAVYDPSQKNLTQAWVTVSNLTDGTTYKFRVYPKNSLNTGISEDKWNYVETDPVNVSSSKLTEYHRNKSNVLYTKYKIDKTFPLINLCFDFDAVADPTIPPDTTTSNTENSSDDKTFLYYIVIGIVVLLLLILILIILCVRRR